MAHISPRFHGQFPLFHFLGAGSGQMVGDQSLEGSLAQIFSGPIPQRCRRFPSLLRMIAGRSSGARAPASIRTGFRCAVQKWLPHSFETEQVHGPLHTLHVRDTMVNSFFVCHKSCAHGFKTERVHLHHCIPLRWGTESSIF